MFSHAFGSHGILDIADYAGINARGDVEDIHRLIDTFEALINVNPHDSGAGYVQLGDYEFVMNGHNLLAEKGDADYHSDQVTLEAKDGNPNVINDFINGAPDAAFWMSEIQRGDGGGLDMRFLAAPEIFMDLFQNRPATLIAYSLPEVDASVSLNRGNRIGLFDVLSGDGGDDSLFGQNGADELWGGTGTDTMRGGEGGDLFHGEDDADWIYGENGNDTVFGEGGGDTVFGGAGVDRIDGGSGVDFLYGDGDGDWIYGADGDWIFGGGGADIVFGQEGGDHIYGEEGTDTLYGDYGDDTLFGGAGVDRVYGGHDDVIFGQAGNDILVGGPGADTIAGNGGEDRLYGEGDDDELSGGDDHDVLFGGGDADELFGRAGADYLDAGIGRDEVYGGAGYNVLVGGLGNDRLVGGEQDDVIYGYEGADYIEGGGDDVIYGGIDNDRLFGQAGDDVIYGEDGADRIEGGDDDDRVYGGLGNDQLYGSDGDDFLVGEFGADTLYGNAGRDILWGGFGQFGPLDFDRDDPADFELPLGFVAAEADYPTGFFAPRIVPVLLNQSSLDGQIADGDDVLRGGDDTDWLFGGSDRDTLDGEAGDDYVDGGSGGDLVHGGADHDVVRGGANDDDVYGDGNIDQVYGDSGSDHLFGDAGDSGAQAGQRLWGGSGIDYLYPHASTTDVASQSLLVGDELHGGAGGDWLYGNIRREILIGDEGNDTILGDTLIGPGYLPNSNSAIVGADDLLLGGSGEDKLYGGGGGNELRGGADSDWLEGQNGNDALYGEGWIDMLVLDSSPDYDILGDHFDGHFGIVGDDHATDIMLIEGSDANDVVLLSEEVALIGSAPVPPQGVLSAEAVFDLTLNDGVPITVTVPAGETSGNTGIDDLVDDLNAAVELAGLASQVAAVAYGDRIALVTRGQGRGTSLVVSSSNPVTQSELHLADAQAAAQMLVVDLGIRVADEPLEDVEYRTLLATWRNGSGTPLVEQFRIAGLGGNDHLEFITGPAAVDVSYLSARGVDWVGVLDGGPGDETLRGSGARDRLEAGRVATFCTASPVATNSGVTGAPGSEVQAITTVCLPGPATTT